jgi:hypothetical protein
LEFTDWRFFATSHGKGPVSAASHFWIHLNPKTSNFSGKAMKKKINHPLPIQYRGMSQLIMKV